MPQYLYKNFKVIYTVKEAKGKDKLYEADGHVVCYSNGESKPALSKKFHTEYPGFSGAQCEIRKLLEDYIDFEWKAFNHIYK